MNVTFVGNELTFQRIYSHYSRINGKFGCNRRSRAFIINCLEKSSIKQAYLAENTPVQIKYSTPLLVIAKNSPVYGKISSKAITEKAFESRRFYVGIRKSEFIFTAVNSFLFPQESEEGRALSGHSQLYSR